MIYSVKGDILLGSGYVFEQRRWCLRERDRRGLEEEFGDLQWLVGIQ